MEDSGFDQLDCMQIAKFAEGESFVLMQKLARDRVKAKKAVTGTGAEEEAVFQELQGCKGAEWIAKTDKVYLLAELVMDRTMQQLTGAAALPKGIARPFARL